MPARRAPMTFSERAFTNERLEAFYTERLDPPLFVTRPDLSAEARRAREMEIRGYRTGGAVMPPGRVRFFMYACETPSEVPPQSVAAIRAVVADMEPSWVASVAEARRYADCPRVVAAWCEIPLQAVMACLEVLRQRDGERGRSS